MGIILNYVIHGERTPTIVGPLKGILVSKDLTCYGKNLLMIHLDHCFYFFKLEKPPHFFQSVVDS